MRSMLIVEDAEFHCLMKTGRPAYRIPTAKMVATDVHVVYNHVKDRIAMMLQVSQTRLVAIRSINSHFVRTMMAA